MLARVIFGVFGLAGAVGMLIAIGRVVWHEIRILNYAWELDEWAEDVPPWR